MSEFNSEQINKLPKWVQQKVSTLQLRNEELRRENDRLRAAMAGNGGSAFKIAHGLRAEDIGLPDSAKYLRWEAEDGFELQLQTVDGELQVMCTTWHGVKITPSASNVVHIGRGRTK